MIADQVRMRRDLQPIRPGDEAAIELRLLTERRSDLVEDRTRALNRLKSLLNGMFPALERALDLGRVGTLVLLTAHQNQVAIRRMGQRHLTTWLRNRKVYRPDVLAAKAVEAAERQHTAVAGEKAISEMVHALTRDVLALNEKITEVDKLIEVRFREHELADVVTLMPGIGAVLGAELLAAIGGSMDAFPTPDRLAAFAGVAPAPRDSGQVNGNLHRPKRYHRRMQRVFYQSALVSIRCDPNSRRFYDRKRAEAKRHVQAVLALARRRVSRRGWAHLGGMAPVIVVHRPPPSGGRRVTVGHVILGLVPAPGWTMPKRWYGGSPQSQWHGGRAHEYEAAEESALPKVLLPDESCWEQGLRRR